MPLKALLQDQELISIDLPKEVFETLRGRRDLRMACCETAAIPKRSVLGLPFFAHAKGGECGSAPETAFHLQGKAIILRAARAAGWEAWVEVGGRTPSGERWRADVLCIQGHHRVAFELQHSGITLSTLAARQARYRESNLRCMWFMHTHERRLAQAQPWQRNTPALYLNAKHHVPMLDLTLEQTVEAALGGHLALFPLAGRPVQVTLIAQATNCYMCRGGSGVLEAVLVYPPGLPELAVIAPGTTPGLAEWIQTVLPQPEVGRMQRFIEWPTNAYRTYSCPGCHRLGLMSRFKPNLDLWRKEAQRMESVPGEAQWVYMGSQGRLASATLTLNPQQQAWLTQHIGQRWVLRSLTE